MYIMITNRCNMTCAHCCYSCTSKGIDMEFTTFKKIMFRWGHLLRQQKYHQILLGGGEPTIHPEFWKFLAYGMANGRTWLATNGKLTEDTLILIELARQNKIGLTLSQDEWHDPINPIVIAKMKEGLVPRKDTNGWVSPDGKLTREIRSTKAIKRGGRCKEGIKACPCPRIQIRPNGNIHGCGCEDAPQIGTVEEGFFPEYLEYIPMLNNPAKFRTCSKKWLKKMTATTK